MNVRVGIRLLGCLLLVAGPFFATASKAQDNSGTKGIDTGNYNIQQSVEFGYRANWINGNQNNYDTFVNLGSGMRLFDYTLDMRSLDHRGVFFDSLNFSNFGYGGDPNDVTRLRIEKNRWYDFRRRVPAGQEFLELQPAGESVEPDFFQSGDSLRQFAARTGPDAAHARLQFDTTAAIEGTIPPGLFPLPQ